MYRFCESYTLTSTGYAAFVALSQNGRLRHREADMSPAADLVPESSPDGASQISTTDAT